MLHPQPLLSIRGLTRSFTEGQRTLTILAGVDLAVQSGEFVALLGRSGSGKSTLLHLVAGLDRPDAGTLLFQGTPAHQHGGMHQFRNRHIGMVFQAYHLLPELTALENTLLPALMGSNMLGWIRQRSILRTRASELLTRMGLGDRLNHKPSKLSGGEKQRVAIARALINQPKLLLADEPTGNLDAQTAKEIMQLLQDLHQGGLGMLLVTHDERIAKQADRIVHLEHGRIVSSLSEPQSSTNPPNPTTDSAQLLS
jgi:ABC-type lipoprotein export system ATPase subunit